MLSNLLKVVSLEWRDLRLPYAQMVLSLWTRLVLIGKLYIFWYMDLPMSNTKINYSHRIVNFVSHLILYRKISQPEFNSIISTCMPIRPHILIFVKLLNVSGLMGYPTFLFALYALDKNSFTLWFYLPRRW